MKILITGGAGFIGSNLCDYFTNKGLQVVCLDNLSTGFKKNIQHLLDNPLFTFIEGDIRDLNTCKKAVKDCEAVLHQAALGSVPRSIDDPINTNSVNIDGFLNMLVSAYDEGIKRFVYAASSSTYGDSKTLPKIEHCIGKPLSPYAVTKYVNELYANVFSSLFGMDVIGLRYFNVFGKRQDTNGAYAAVIPLWVKALINHQAPVVNGDGSFSRDFTYIDNVIQANELALSISKEDLDKKISNYKSENSIITGNDLVFNVAYGGNTTLIKLFECLRLNLGKFDNEINTINPEFRENRQGDIPHSQASIEKAKSVLLYKPLFSAEKGFEMACEWYWKNLR